VAALLELGMGKGMRSALPWQKDLELRSLGARSSALQPDLLRLKRNPNRSDAHAAVAQDLLAAAREEAVRRVPLEPAAGIGFNRVEMSRWTQQRERLVAAQIRARSK